MEKDSSMVDGGLVAENPGLNAEKSAERDNGKGTQDDVLALEDIHQQKERFIQIFGEVPAYLDFSTVTDEKYVNSRRGFRRMTRTKSKGSSVDGGLSTELVKNMAELKKGILLVKRS